MVFAEPDTCPDCRTRLGSATRCPGCDLDLTTEAAQHVLAALRAADGWLARARAESIAPVTAPAPTTSGLPTAPPVTGQRPSRASGSRLSAGAIILALGALCLLVAGAVFLSVAWGSLGVAGRALVLLVFTTLVGAAAVAVTRRTLRGSAEALWAVTLGLASLDWFAARDQGLLGLDAVPSTPWLCAWAALVVAAGVAVVRVGRRNGLRELVVPSLAAGLAPAVAAVALAAEVGEAVHPDRAAFWAGITAAATLGAAVGVAVLARLRLALVAAGVGTALAAVIAVGAAVLEAVWSPSLRELAAEGHGVPLLVVAGLGAVPAATRALPALVRTGGALLSSAALVVLTVVPAEDAAPGRGGLVAATLLLLVLAVPTGRSPAVLGVRLAGAVLTAGVALVAATWLGVLAAGVAGASDGGGEEAFTARIDLPGSGIPEPWLPLLVGVGLGAWLLLALRRDDVLPPAVVRPSALVLALGGALVALVALRPPAVLLALGILAAAAVLVASSRPARSGWDLAAAGAAAVAAGCALDSWFACLVVWPLAAGLLGVVAARHRGQVAAVPSAGAAALVALVPLAAVAAAGGTDRGLSLAAAGGAAAVLLAPHRLVREDGRRLGVEGGAVAAGLVAVGVAADLGSMPWTALVLTVLGAAAAVVAVLVPDRRWYRGPAAAVLGLAWVLRLLASDVDVVEAYTAPFAAVLLAAGAWSLRRPDGPGSARALGAGLTLALVPSLPQALDDPTSLRALLLGLVAAAALAAGVLGRLRAPLLAGAAVLALVVAANLGPYAAAVPRWVLIAAAGLVLLGTGVTWEDRVRDGRAAVRRIATMR